MPPRKERAPRKRRTPSPRSLKVSSAFKAFVLDQLGDLGGVTAKSMFGGVGLYCRGVFFAILARDVLYLKTDERMRGDFERAGAETFRPFLDRADRMTSYYSVPIDVLESPTDLVAWARKSVAAARRLAR